MLNISLETVM